MGGHCRVTLWPRILPNYNNLFSFSVSTWNGWSSSYIFNSSIMEIRPTGHYSCSRNPVPKESPHYFRTVTSDMQLAEAISDLNLMSPLHPQCSIRAPTLRCCSICSISPWLQCAAPFPGKGNHREEAKLRWKTETQTANLCCHVKRSDAAM